MQGGIRWLNHPSDHGGRSGFEIFEDGMPLFVSDWDDLIWWWPIVGGWSVFQHERFEISVQLTSSTGEPNVRIYLPAVSGNIEITIPYFHLLM